MEKNRIDKLLTDLGLAPSREKAQALIMAGVVYANSQKVSKPSETYPPQTMIEVKGEDHPYVSRGGVKLAGALDHFQVQVEGKTCLDIGASTGGFTDCLLKRGAKKVYAVDVGYGQFHWKLRQDPRVELLERTNFRHLKTEKIPEKIEFVVGDVSFISLDKILPNLLGFLAKKSAAMILVKPQFELGPKEVKKGVVHSEELRQKAIAKITHEAERLEFTVIGGINSQISGPKGNLEYFLYLEKNSCH